MNEKKTVLIVHNYYQLSGGEDTVVANEKKMLEKHGHRVILYSRSNSELKTMRALKKIVLPITTVFNPKTYRDIKKIIKDERIDIVHVHNTLFLISPAVYYAAKRMNIPLVQTIHNFRMLCPGATFYRDGHICEECVSNGLKCAMKHKCYRKSRLQTLTCVISMKIHRFLRIYGKINYICLTEFNKKKLLNLKQIREDRVFIKPNFVEANDEFISLNGRENQCIFVGRLDKLKGIDILLHAWKELGENAPKLVICGTGPMEKWCKDYVEENRLNVEMKGFVTNEEARRLMGRSKALILPTQWYEGFPMSIVEAYSVGTPVIGSDLGNVGSVIKIGINGEKFDNKSIYEIEQCVKLVCANTTKYDVLKLYNELYSEEINYSTLENIYRNCI